MKIRRLIRVYTVNKREAVNDQDLHFIHEKRGGGREKIVLICVCLEYHMIPGSVY